jgi:methionyl-tRNA formyltransferase
VSLRIGIVGAVRSTETALATLAAAGHTPAVLVTLPVEKQARHSDFVDLGPLADQLGVAVLRAGDVNTPAVLEELARFELDVLFVVGWSRICGPGFRALARVGALGYHPTLLPKMRGRAALAWTIILGLERTGATVFWLDEGVDSGDIAAQEEFEIPPYATVSELYDLHLEALRRMLPPLFAQLAAGEIPSQVQDHRAATYLAVRRPAHGEIRWSEEAAAIERLVRGVSRPYPGAFTTLAGRKLLIWSAKVVAFPNWHAQVGQAFAIEDGAPVVRCGAGTDLALLDFELEDAADPPPLKLLRGQPVLGR